MKIIVMQMYDGWAIDIDGETHSFDQEDTVERLVDVLANLLPDAEVAFEEVY